MSRSPTARVSRPPLAMHATGLWPNFVDADTAVLTAQHRDDQAETLLLQLLRGAGPAGAAGMAALRRFGDGWIARPLLGFGRDEILDYIRCHDLVPVDDPHNDDAPFRFASISERRSCRRLAHAGPERRRRWLAQQRMPHRRRAGCASWLPAICATSVRSAAGSGSSVSGR